MKQTILGILFNKKYCRKSLYGAGIFPFWLYVKFYGEPLYRVGRKLRLPPFFALMLANTLGSDAHVKFFRDHPLTISIPMFVLSLFLTTGVMWWMHSRWKSSLGSV